MSICRGIILGRYLACARSRNGLLPFFSFFSPRFIFRCKLPDLGLLIPGVEYAEYTGHIRIYSG